MRYWFDTEFIEDGRTIDLLSIGIVSDDGRTLYLESSEADLSKASPWVRANVFPHMDWSMQIPRSEIRDKVLKFCAETEERSGPEFWAYYADYDWVVLCQLFGRMVDLPKGWPMYCRDFKQLLDEHGAVLTSKSPAHNALTDAIWLRHQHIGLLR